MRISPSITTGCSSFFGIRGGRGMLMGRGGEVDPGSLLISSLPDIICVLSGNELSTLFSFILSVICVVGGGFSLDFFLASSSFCCSLTLYYIYIYIYYIKLNYVLIFIVIPFSLYLGRFKGSLAP